MVDLKAILESTGLPVAFVKFGKKQTPPFIIYLVDDSDNFSADNIVYHALTDYDIEFYSNLKDTTNEAKIELALTNNDIFYEKEEAWIETEELYQVIYTIRR